MNERETVIEKLGKIAGFFEARADMAIGDGKLILLSWVKAARDAAKMLETCDGVSCDASSADGERGESVKKI